jgi:transketolase
MTIFLKKFAPKRLRELVLKMAFNGQAVHIGCAFSIVEILAVLYRRFLKYPDNDPNSENRDFLILSKGHGVMAQYACLHELGWVSDEMIANYFADGSTLNGLSDSRIAGLEVTSGSLGHGFSVGVGIAYGLTRLNKSQKVYVLVGDGELNEGAIWEGAMFASHHKLSNLIVIVDENSFQAMGETENILNLGSTSRKFESFGFEVKEVDGHNESQIENTISKIIEENNPLPKVIIAKTVKGKGVNFMEGDNKWHYTRLNDKTYKDALDYLNGVVL